MTASAFRFCDDLGPKTILHIYEPAIGLKAIAVVDNTAAGAAIGGVRMAPDVSLDECFRLARGMTLKNAAAGLPHGGGKSVILGDTVETVTVKAGLGNDTIVVVPAPQIPSWPVGQNSPPPGLPSSIPSAQLLSTPSHNSVCSGKISPEASLQSSALPT